MNSNILWTPSPQRIGQGALARFCRDTAALHGAGPQDYAALHEWSVRQPEPFWSALWDFLGLIGNKGDTAFDPGTGLRDARFFPGARLNYTENLLREPDDRRAIIAHRDDGTTRCVTRRELADNVSRITAALRAHGIGPGDRIAGIVTNDLESIQFYLASAAIGAIWASCSPDFGPAGASDRLNQVAPRLLVATPSYRYGDKHIDIADTMNAVASAPSVEKIITFGPVPAGQTFAKPAISLDAWIAPFAPSEIEYHRAPFDTPMVILFSSGTTGKPKCIVHRAGGLLLQHLKEHALHCDIGEGDVLFYFTTCGWMMWNWQISALALGATLSTYDGNPFYPEPARLMDLIDVDGITVFGTSAKYIDALQKAGVRPAQSHDLSRLRAILSTGSPLLPASFDYVYRDVKSDVHLASISGGTDICACFVGGVPSLPVVRGELQGPMLGLDVDAVDAQTRPVTGEPGELVCRNAHPTMPLGFWQDETGERYRDAYFSQHEGVWSHGDFIERRPSGGFIIHGRSDTTLNPGGVRIGTSEIYRQVETLDQVVEAVAVGLDRDGDQQVVLFVRLAPDAQLTDELVATIRQRIRKGATPRHVPAMIAAVSDIPRTRSGKISEIAVRDTIHGRPIKNTTALANASCLEEYARWARENVTAKEA